MPATLLHAPNVHTGGGLVLLRALLADWPADGRRVAFLDQRAREQLTPPADAEVHWVQATAASRLAAERTLRRASGAGDTVLCLHGLPPLLAGPARVVVFQQNRNYLGLNPLRDFAPRTALRLAFERQLSLWLRRRVDRYIVQTPTMARSLRAWFGPGCPPVLVRPFLDRIELPPAASREHDFVYVADGEAMKNHARLLQAWSLLAEQGLRPGLALTLGPRDAALATRLHDQAVRDGLRLTNLGHITRADVLALYRRAGALIFPSLSESFGLPLIEAAAAGLPIVACELDYVRDVCQPVQTFDPLSPVSIARAVRRFLDRDEQPLAIGEPATLWEAASGSEDPR